MDKLRGRYHPDPEINDDVAGDAMQGELYSIAAGLPPSPWECECGASHARGFYPVGGMAHRCLRCGYVGANGRLMDPNEVRHA